MRSVRVVVGAGIPAIAACAVLLAACDAIFVDPAPAESALVAIAFSINSASAGDAQAFDRADGARILLQRRRDGSVVFDGVVGLSPGGRDREATVDVELVEDPEVFDISAVLMSGSQSLFQGATSVTIRKGQPALAEIPLQPIITEIRLAASSVTFTSIGQTATLRAAALFATGDTARNAAIQWQSQNSSIASVSGDGSVIARGEGLTQIVARAGSVTALVQVRVQVNVASVAVTPASVSMRVGDQQVLTAVARDGNGNTLARTPTWTSSNTLVASVDASGRVLAASAGQATITATVQGVIGTASISVTLDPVELVSVTPSTATIFVGNTQQYAATLRTASGAAVLRPVQWTSSNTTVATVDGTGLVTGRLAGVATITATSEGVSGSAQVGVQNPVSAVFDLIANSVTVTPASPTTSQTFTVAGSISNAGNTASGAFTWRLRVDATVVASGQLSLAAGASTTVSSTTINPYGAGNYTAWLDVDPTNAVIESNETNNTAQRPFIVSAASFVDLVANSVTVTPASPTASQTFTIDGSISNAGNTTSGTFTWQLVTGVSVAVTTVVATGQISIAAGASATVSAVAVGPYNAGSYNAWLYVDPANALAESSETNNTAQQPFTVGAAPFVDLVANSVTITPASPTTSQTFTIQGSVSNAGNTASGNFWWRVRVGTTVVDSGQISLGAGNSTSVSSVAIGPYGAGSYTAWLDIDPANTVTESIETNNAAQQTFTVIAASAIDLVADTFYVASPPSPNEADDFMLYGRVVHTGTVASGTFAIRYKIDGLVIDSVQTSLSPGQSAGISFSAIGPYAAGTYTATLEVDYNNVVMESNEANNTFEFQFTILSGSPDLVIGGGPLTGMPLSVPAGAGVALSRVWVKNQGTRQSRAYAVGYYLSLDPTITSADFPLSQSGQSGGLSVGDSADFGTPTIPIPGGTAPGTYWLGVLADWADDVGESDESNNFASVQITVSAPAPDLVIAVAGGTYTATPSAVVQGGIVSFPRVWVKNQGSANASGFKVGTYVSTDQTITASDVLLGETGFLSVTAGDSVDLGTSSITANFVPGTYWVGILADNTSAVTESSESNNFASAQITVSAPAPPPSVTIQSIERAGTSIPVQLNNVTGVIDIVTNFSFPSGTGTSWKVAIGGTDVCSQSFTGGGSGQLICTVDTADYDGITGVVDHFNGPTTVMATVTDLSNTASSGPVGLTLNNTSFLKAGFSGATGPVNGTYCSGPWSCPASWYGGNVTVTVLPVIFESASTSAIAQVTATLTPGGAGIGNPAARTDVTSPFAIMFPANSSNGVQGVEEEFAISIAALTTGGQPGPTCVNPDPVFNPISTCGTWFPGPLLVDNLSPRVTSYDVLRPGQWFSTQAFNCSPTPCIQTSELGVGLDTVEPLAGPPGSVGPVTSMVDLPESSTNGAYVAAVNVADGLGNQRTVYATPVPVLPSSTTTGAQTFGIDRTAPSLIVASGPPNGSTNDLSSLYTLNFADGGIGPSGFGVNPVHTTLEQRTPSGVSCYSPSPVPSPIACSGPVADDGSVSLLAGSEGYWVVNASAADRAGNESPTVSRVTLVDVTSPSIGLIGGPINPIPGGGSAPFFVPATDNVALRDGRAAVGYGSLTIGYSSVSVGTYNPAALVGSSSFSLGISGFIKSVEATLGSGAPTGSPVAANIARFIVADVAGNTANGAFGIGAVGPFPSSILSTWNGANPAHGLFDNAPPSESIVCNNSPRVGCLAGRPLATSLVATATGPSSAPVPFGVTFYYQDAAGWWEPIGSGSVTLIDAGMTRTFSFAFVWTPAGLPPGSYDIMALGVAADGTALLSGGHTITVEGM